MHATWNTRSCCGTALEEEHRADCMYASAGRIEARMDVTQYDGDVLTAARVLLQSTTGLDVDTEHGADTPKRFVNMLRDMTLRDPEFRFTTFPNTEMVDEIILVDNIDFYTLCHHHVVPFYGHAHVAYIPDRELVGLSKIPRAVRHIAKGLWVQEHLTKEIADYLESRLRPKGVAVVIQAEHMCMTMRGVQAVGSLTTTSAMRGFFADHSRTAKAELMTLLQGKLN